MGIYHYKFPIWSTPCSAFVVEIRERWIKIKEGQPFPPQHWREWRLPAVNVGNNHGVRQTFKSKVNHVVTLLDHYIVHCIPIISQPSCLTHWGQDKMAAIFQMTFWNGFSWMKMYELRLKISLKFVPRGPINIIPVLVQIMACRLTDTKLNQWWSAYWRIYVSIGLNELKEVIKDTLELTHMGELWVSFVSSKSQKCFSFPTKKLCWIFYSIWWQYIQML